MTRKRLYLFTLLACTAGLTWLALNVYIPSLALSGRHFCIFRAVTGIPCPACGSTRSMICLLDGDLPGALFTNPAGLILFFSMMIFPVWVIADLVLRKESFLRFYRNFERILRKRWITILLILLVLANWAWNIVKGL